MRNRRAAFEHDLLETSTASTNCAIRDGNIFGDEGHFRATRRRAKRGGDRGLPETRNHRRFTWEAAAASGKAGLTGSPAEPAFPRIER
jgi:hypothetical protein